MEEYNILGLLLALSLMGVCWGACPAGQATNWCSEQSRTVSASTQALSIDNTNVTLTECQDKCLQNPTCNLISYALWTVGNPSSCRLYSNTFQNAALMGQAGTDVHYFVCGATCSGNIIQTTPTPTPLQTTATSPTPEPETTSEPAPEGEAEISAQQFWQWLRDEPVWFALIGMGVFILLLLIVIIVLICSLKGRKTLD